MIPEAGHFALILALCLALIQGVVPLLGSFRGNAAWIGVAQPAALGQALFVIISFVCLAWSFVHNDFSVAYVAQQSNTELPIQYRISALWGGHEGSLLLWALMLSLWGAAVSLFSGSMPAVMRARVLAVMGLVAVGFMLFMLLTSNPFDRLFPAPPEGRSLNPLLQDPGLVIHPPMLYMGYVGFSVAFAFAVAAMLEGRLDAAWARWTRPWTTVAWMFLTVGIALGSWWAYYELGWGGWWFWDPVENASFMPWLVGTALIHSLASTEKRGVFKSWTILLAISAFSLSLLGTFLVRSGVLTSVHAFASDPTRGVFILAFLAVVVGSSLILYAWRLPNFRSVAKLDLFSREGALLLNNVLLVITAASVLLGTLYPLALDALKLGKISVGPPYFNSVFLPLTIPLALLLGLGIHMRWKQDRANRLLKPLALVMLASLVVATLLTLVVMPGFNISAFLAFTLALWISFSSLFNVYEKVAHKARPLVALRQLPRGYFGMSFAHIGVAVFIVGITLTSQYSLEEDIRLSTGQVYSLGGYDFKFHGVKDSVGPNYRAAQGTFEISKNGKLVAELHPQKRMYNAGGMPMTEAGIDPGLFRDLYVSLGESLDGKGAWSVRVYYKPFVRWIWLGALFMAFGGFLSVTDRRYRQSMAKDRMASLAGDATA